MDSFKTHVQQLDEGVNDPAIFKAIFLAGGPGSGKSFIVGKTGLPQLGYKVVNSDDAYENAMKKAGLKMSPENIFSDKGQELRGGAKRLTAKKQALYIQGRLGIVVDGTGKDPAKIAKQAIKMRALGYDVAMIFVNTDKETALERNRMRERSLPDAEVAKYWELVQKNIGRFQQMFGKKDFLVVDNSTGKDYKTETLRAFRDAKKFTDRPPQSKIAQKWIEQEKKSRGIKEETLNEGIEVGDEVLLKRNGSHGKVRKIKGNKVTVFWAFSKTPSDVSLGELSLLSKKKKRKSGIKEDYLPENFDELQKIIGSIPEVIKLEKELERKMKKLGFSKKDLETNPRKVAANPEVLKIAMEYGKKIENIAMKHMKRKPVDDGSGWAAAVAKQDKRRFNKLKAGNW